MNSRIGGLPPSGQKPPEVPQPPDGKKPKHIEPADHVFMNMAMTKAQFTQAQSTFFRMLDNDFQKCAKNALEAIKRLGRKSRGEEE